MAEGTLSGLNALVTGAGRGIGQAVAIALGKEGANVVVHYHTSTEGALATADAIRGEGVQAIAVPADLVSTAIACCPYHPPVPVFPQGARYPWSGP